MGSSTLQGQGGAWLRQGKASGAREACQQVLGLAVRHLRTLACSQPLPGQPSMHSSICRLLLLMCQSVQWGCSCRVAASRVRCRSARWHLHGTEVSAFSLAL